MLRQSLVIFFFGKGEIEYECDLETYELFICGDTHNIASSHCTNVLKIAAPYPRLWIVFFINVYYY
jgi:hypothetical protein